MMKRLIIALCSLALSCAGTFGINQFVNQNDLTINKNMEQVIEEDAGETKDDAAPVTDAKKEEGGAAKNTENKVADKSTVNIDKENNNAKTAGKTVTKKTVSSNTDKTSDRNTVNQSVTDTSKANTAGNKKVADNTKYSGSNSDGYKTKTVSDNCNGNTAYIYKKIDLSDCNSVEEVVEKLQNSGYKNINSENIYNIGSLEDILSMTGQNSSNNSGKTSTVTTPDKNAATSESASSKKTDSSQSGEKATTSKNTAETASDSNSGSSYAEEVLRLVNIERSKAGLSPLTTNSTLKAAADKRAQETAVSFSHTRPNGTSFSTVLKEYGVSYRTAGENIAYGQRSPQEVVTAWMNSSGHRANILNANYNKIGIGVYKANGVIYWSQLFTN